MQLITCKWLFCINDLTYHLTPPVCIFPQQLTTKMTLQRQLIISNYRSFSCCLFVPSSLFVVTRGSYHPSYFYAYYNINSHLTFDTLW